MGKFIIENKSSVCDMLAIDLVKRVMSEGRVSNDGKQYCYVSIFEVNGVEIVVYSGLNEKSDKFTIVNC